MSTDTTTHQRTRRPTAALMISVLALFVALSGVATALPGKNTVNSGDIKDETIKSKDLRDGKAVQTQDIVDETITATDLGADSVGAAEISSGAVSSSEISNGAVQAAEIADGIHSHGNAVLVGGGAAHNGAYATKSVTASCGPGEELISGSGRWSGNGTDEELFLAEVDLNHNAEQVTVQGGNDSGVNRYLYAVAHCLG